MSNKTKLFISSLAILLPSVALAALPGALDSTASDASRIVTQTLPRLFFGLAIVYFFWGLGSYAFGVDEKKKEDAKRTMLYGIIIIFIMSSIWGIVTAIQTSTGVTGGGTVTVPTIQ